MSQQQEPIPGQTPPDASATQEIKLSPTDLARSWLGYRGSEVQREIKSTESSLNFYSTYEPTHPGPRPHPEDGGMDHSDWEVSMGEYSQWPEEQEEKIEYTREELDRLHDQMNTILDEQERVNAGDMRLIEKYSELEIDRRAKMEEARKREEDRKIGREFEGIDEVKAQLDEITSAVRVEPRDSQGFNQRREDIPSGWQIYRYLPEEPERKNPEQFQFMLTPDKDKPDNAVFIRLYAENQGYRLNIEDFRNAQETDKTLFGHERKGRKGVQLSLDIRDGKVYDPNVRDSVEERPFGYPERFPSDAGEKFAQNHFDELKGLINSLSADIKSAQTAPVSS